MNIGDVVMDDQDLKIFTGNGLSTISIGAGNTMNSVYTTANTINFPKTTTEEILDKYSFNEVFVEHKITAAELLAIKDTVDYKDIIKQNLTKQAGTEIVNKISFTKKHDVDSDTHAFRGRVWVFTKEELLQLIEDIKK